MQKYFVKSLQGYQFKTFFKIFLKILKFFEVFFLKNQFFFLSFLCATYITDLPQRKRAVKLNFTFNYLYIAPLCLQELSHDELLPAGGLALLLVELLDLLQVGHVLLNRKQHQHL